jgi:hypothetical protein
MALIGAEAFENRSLRISANETLPTTMVEKIPAGLTTMWLTASIKR